MKKIFLAFVISILMLYFSPNVLGQVHAASLGFDQTSFTVATDDTVQAIVTIDAGSDEVRSADIYVTYDPTLVEALQVTPKDFFPVVTNDITSGKVAISAYFNPGDVTSAKSGTGSVAGISFKGLKAGTATLAFSCGSSTGSKIIKNDVGFTNVINCTANKTATVAIGGGGSSSSVTPTPTTSLSSGAEPTPSVLPQTGVFDNAGAIIIPGLFLLLVGFGLKLFL